ncbi:alpha/beta hydrolase [Streptomyces colonosanans]|uniref:Esterase n=1 Tax=Streptomyces colonosanans TaxID=1428652 RepID=A0A1S2PM35_9ACTN|nr:alpha/beta hydrolase-fold protein [Streptomyces colonosanans]OIJ94606.1 esterase [Streptomyces colonosanans]
MGLTSQTLLVLAISLSAAAFGTAVWLWPYLSRTTWRSMLGRIGMLLGIQLACLAALALAINNYFGFYGSWGDLLGTDEDGTAIIADGTAAVSHTNAVHILDHQQLPAPDGTAATTGGSLETVEIRGAKSHLSTRAYVYLPPQYGQPQYAQVKFPLIIALTGYPGTTENLITRLKYPELADAAIARKEMPPTILVLMRPTLAPPRDTECIDIPGGPQVESFFTQDLPTALGTAYRVGDSAAYRGVIGDSTGGYCALKFAMRHPGTYTAAVALSGYYRAEVDATTGDLFGGSKQLQRENDLMWRLRNLPPPAVSVLVTTSRHGESNYQATQDFLAAAEPPMKTASIILPSGGHNFATWSRELPQALPWLGRQLQAPRVNPVLAEAAPDAATS